MTEIEAILKDAPDAGRRPIASKLRSTYAITIDDRTLGRWLNEHRDALTAGTLERPMLDDDGKPEDYADEIAAILKKEPHAGRIRVQSELQRLYRVSISMKRLETYLGSLDRSAIAGGAMSSDSIARRRSPKEDMEQGNEWPSLNEA